MPDYKLVYFNAKGRAEPVRFMFQLAGVDYEDKRVTQDEWKSIKPTTSFGQVPLLYIDGKELPQSGAILRYIASEHGFYPTKSWDRAQVDVVLETLGDLEPGLTKIFEENDPSKKAEVLKKFTDEDSAKVLDNLEKLLKKNQEGKGWFVGDKITIADISVFCMLHDLLPAVMGLDLGKLDLKERDCLKSVVDRFKSEAKVSEWLERRPKNQF